jgi:hypothetical protein
MSGLIPSSPGLPRPSPDDGGRDYGGSVTRPGCVRAIALLDRFA